MLALALPLSTRRPRRAESPRAGGGPFSEDFSTDGSSRGFFRGAGDDWADSACLRFFFEIGAWLWFDVDGVIF